jgi:small subunit ribosomal protein S33
MRRKEDAATLIHDTRLCDVATFARCPPDRVLPRLAELRGCCQSRGPLQQEVALLTIISSKALLDLLPVRATKASHYWHKLQIRGMLLAQRCVSIWRHVCEAFVNEGVQPGARRFCSNIITSVGTEESLEQIRSRIFGTYIGNGLRSGRKVLRKGLIGDKIASYYPEPVTKYDPMFVDMNIERCATSLHWQPSILHVVTLALSLVQCH